MESLAAPTTKHLLINWLSSTDQRTGSQLLSIVERCIHMQCMHLHSCIYVYIYMYVCMYVCMLHSRQKLEEAKQRDEMNRERAYYLFIYLFFLDFNFKFHPFSILSTINSLPFSFSVNSNVLSKWTTLWFDVIFSSDILMLYFQFFFFFFFNDITVL